MENLAGQRIAAAWRRGHDRVRLLLAVLALACMPVHAAVLGYDSFSYPVGALGGNNGGTGWAAAWQGGGSNQVVAAGLAHPGGGLTVAGGADQLNAPFAGFPVLQSRNLGSSFGAVTETIWVSMLLQPQETTSPTNSYMGLVIGSGGPGNTNQIFFGYSGTNFKIQDWGGGGLNVTVPGVMPGQTVFLVLRLDIDAAGVETATLYLNPTAGLPAPDVAPSSAKNDLDLGSPFGTISIGGGRNGATNPSLLDEIRIGNSYVDVAPPPVDLVFNVDSTLDLLDAMPGDGICATAGGQCTLRAAVQESNAWGGTDTINVPPGTYLLTRAGASEDLAVDGDLDITDEVTLQGTGTAATVIDGNQLDRIFEVRAPTATISGLTVDNGQVNAEGGGIRVHGINSLTLTDATVSGSDVLSKKGGGIFVASGSLTLVNVTLSGNLAKEGGGIFVQSASVDATNVTITANSVTSKGSGLVPGSGSMTFRNSIIAGNAGAANCDAVAGPGVNNLDDDGSCGFALTAAPVLGPLQDNGGPTTTHALLAGSPAIDSGSDGVCPAADQRGELRPFDGDGDLTATCDIGAFELIAFTVSGTVFEDVNYGGGAGRDLVTAGGVPVPGAVVELYDGAGSFLLSTTAAAPTGQYSFAVSPGNYQVRVVNDTVDSTRSGATGSEMPVQTFRTDASGGTAIAVTDHVGGEIPAEVDAGTNGSSATLATLNAPAGTEVQSLTPVTVSAANIAAIDFGFNFDLIVNTNDAGQGSLRQFKDNSNALDNAGLAQEGRPANNESAIFMLADGTARPGMNTGYASQFSGGVATIEPLTLILAFTKPVILDATTQPGFGSVPVVELNGINVAGDGFTLNGGNSTLRGWVINRCGSNGVYSAAGGGGNIFDGNYIGTNSTGTAPSANGANGISIRSHPNNTISANLIAGNAGNGLSLLDAGSTGNIVRGNYIGVNSAGTPIPNTLNGIRIAASSSNTIGGTGAGEANTIAHNGKHGILLYASGGTPTGTIITANSIHDNTLSGIDLSAVASNNGDGPTPNNGTKNAGLPNFDIDTPVVTSAILAGSNLTLAGYVGNAPGQPLFAGARVEFFASDTDATDNFGEGERYLDFLTTDGSGNFSGTIAVTGITDSDQITATATDAASNTSEFAANAVVFEQRLIIKRAFQLDGSPIADLSMLPVGLPFRFLLYVDNPAGAMSDTALQDALDPLFIYEPGSMKVDTSLVSSVVCPGGACNEGAIFAQVNSSGTALGDGDAVTAPIDADNGSYNTASSTIDLGDNANSSNGQLDIPADRVLALLFTARIQ
ncbi:MAG: hypothetical protein HKN06_13825 [Gammaproteobacteria bacterium]|nr:hypothetical protein [Gammaproteobacteria bacterium]